MPKEGGQVLMLFSLCRSARTEGCINEKVKGEWDMLAQYKILCVGTATTFGWREEQGVLVPFQKTFRTGTEKQKLHSY